MNASVDPRHSEATGQSRTGALPSGSTPRADRVVARSLQRAAAAVRGRNTGVTTFNSAL